MSTAHSWIITRCVLPATSDTVTSRQPCTCGCQPPKGLPPDRLLKWLRSKLQSCPALHSLQGSYSHSLAEWALAACTWFAKQLPRLKANQEAGTWEKFYVQELR